MGWNFIDLYNISLKIFFSMLIAILIIKFLLNVAILTIKFLLNFILGKKTVIKGEFTIVSKNENVANVFTIKGKTFTLESHNKTKKRYTVVVSNIIYQYYFVGENIKASFASYEKVKTCDELVIKGKRYI